MTTLTLAEHSVRSHAAVGDFKSAAHVWLMQLIDQADDADQTWARCIGHPHLEPNARRLAHDAQQRVRAWREAAWTNPSLAVGQLIARDFQP